MMKKLLSLIILFTAFTLAAYCQEAPEKKHQDFHFIEAGIGAGYTRLIHGAFNAALSNSLNKYIANFIDYNMAFGKSSTLFHEINFKLGPYYQFSRYSYIAVSSGISLIYNTEPMTKMGYSRYNSQFYPGHLEPENLINIPIQAKLNIGVYKGCCIGFKGTLNKMVYNKDVEDKGTVLMYVALGW